jgi:hypothetical protein
MMANECRTTPEELARLLAEAEERYAQALADPRGRRAFVAQWLYDAMHPGASEVDAVLTEAL